MVVVPRHTTCWTRWPSPSERETRRQSWGVDGTGRRVLGLGEAAPDAGEKVGAGGVPGA